MNSSTPEHSPEYTTEYKSVGTSKGTSKATSKATSEATSECTSEYVFKHRSEHSSDPASSTASAQRARLFQHPDLWRAGQLRTAHRDTAAGTTPSGFSELDEHLPGAGWPEAGLSEVLLPTAGVGELQLLMPLMKQLSRQMRWIAWINPPFIPYAPALEAAGIDISKILLIHPKSHKDALWSLERATRSGTCSAALAWLDESQLTLKDTRRLQLAAKQGSTLSCLFRPSQAAAQSSMAELRLQLDRPDTSCAGKPDHLQLSILKRRGGWPIPQLRVALKRERNREEIREQLSLWKLWRTAPPATKAETAVTTDPLQPHGRHVEQHITH